MIIDFPLEMGIIGDRRTRVEKEQPMLGGHSFEVLHYNPLAAGGSFGHNNMLTK